MAYVKCIYGSSDTPSPTPSTKQQGINVYKAGGSMYDPNASYCANYGDLASRTGGHNIISSLTTEFYLGGYPVKSTYTGTNLEYATLSVTINGTSSSVNISTPGATEGTSIVDVRFVSRDIVMIFYYNSTANGLGTVVYARYIKLTKSNTLYQSASLGVCPAQATTTSYYSTVNRYCGNPNSLEWYSMRSYNTLSNNTTTLYLAYTYYNPSAGTATLTSSTASQGSVTGGGDILHSTKYDLAVYNCQVAATTNRIVIRVNRTDSSWQNNGAGDYLYYRTPGKLSDGNYVMYKQGHIIISNIRTDSASIVGFDVLATINIVTDTTHDDYDFLVVSVVNNIMVFYINTTKTILGVSKPAGFYRVKINIGSTYSIELMDDFVASYIGYDYTKFNFDNCTIDSDPFNGVFIYDIDE